MAADYPAWSDYNYVLGNPIMFIDPDGRAAKRPNNSNDRHAVMSSREEKIVLDIFLDYLYQKAIYNGQAVFGYSVNESLPAFQSIEMDGLRGFSDRHPAYQDNNLEGSGTLILPNGVKVKVGLRWTVQDPNKEGEGDIYRHKKTEIAAGWFSPNTTSYYFYGYPTSESKAGRFLGTLDFLGDDMKQFNELHSYYKMIEDAAYYESALRYDENHLNSNRIEGGGMEEKRKAYEKVQEKESKRPTGYGSF